MTNAHQSTVQVLLPITKCNFEILKLFCCLYCKLSLALVSRMKCIRGIKHLRRAKLICTFLFQAGSRKLLKLGLRGRNNAKDPQEATIPSLLKVEYKKSSISGPYSVH